MEIQGLKEYINLLDNISKVSAGIPNKAAIVAVNFSKDRFVDQAWLDSSKTKWQKRKSTRGRSARRQKGAILVNSSRLKRSIRKIQVGTDYAIIGTDVPYARIHNEGGEVNATMNVKTYTKKEYTRKRNGRREKVRSHTVNSHKRTVRFTMPKRQFIGESATLAKREENMIAAEYARAIKNNKQ